MVVGNLPYRGKFEVVVDGDIADDTIAVINEEGRGLVGVGKKEGYLAGKE